MGRPRKTGFKDLPLGMYPNLKKTADGSMTMHWKYRLPNGKFKSLGKNKDEAIKSANYLNQKLRKSIIELTTDHLLTNTITVQEAWNLFLKYMKNRNLKPNTVRSRTANAKRFLAKYGKCPLQEIKTMHVSEVMDEYENEGKLRSSLAVRSSLKEFFRWSQTKGYIEHNVVDATKAATVIVKRSRLSLDQFIMILRYAENRFDPYAANAMLLALLTAQRIEDIVEMRFSDIKDKHCHIQQSKTHAKHKSSGSRVRIDENVYLKPIRLTVGDVVRRCRDNVLSPYLIHHTKTYGNAKAGTGTHKQTLSKKFTVCVRELGDKLTWEEGKNPATFHEIRSLAIRLYKKEYGKEFAQAIAGHKDEASTETYTDVRSSEVWTEVSAVKPKKG